MDHIRGVLTEWRGCDDAQVLAMTKRGASGVRSINATLHAMASPTKPKLEGWGFAEGDPIIYLVNDYEKELWNGSLGRIESILSSNGRRSLLCCLDGARKEIPEEDFRRSVQLVLPDGRVFRGAEAVFGSLSFAPRGGRLLSAYRKVPGFAALTEATYRVIADHRDAASALTAALWGKTV